MVKKMGIIKNVHFGVRDTDYCILSFTVNTSECTASLQILAAKEAIALIEKHQIVDVNDLNGMPCWVEHTTPTQFPVGISKFVDLCKIK